MLYMINSIKNNSFLTLGIIKLSLSMNTGILLWPLISNYLSINCYVSTRWRQIKALCCV